MCVCDFCVNFFFLEKQYEMVSSRQLHVNEPRKVKGGSVLQGGD